MADRSTTGATGLPRKSVAMTSAALIAVAAVAGVGLLVSAIGLLTVDDGTSATLYAGGLGAGLVSLLCLGMATGARSEAPTRAQVVDRLAQQAEIHADRIEGVARSLGDEHHWESGALLEEIEIAERGYDLALKLGETEQASRISSCLAYVRARTGLRTEPKARSRKKHHSI